MPYVARQTLAKFIVVDGVSDLMELRSLCMENKQPLFKKAHETGTDEFLETSPINVR